VINLDTRNRLIHVEKLYVGSVNSSTVRIGELFRAAVQRNATSVIIVHNHPSGDPSPSPEDVNLTRAAVRAGKLMDIEVLDHLVVGQGRYISLKSRGLGFGDGGSSSL
jgi:DNA repair protein RadC